MADKRNPHGTQEYRGNGNHIWELVFSGLDDNTYRLRVPGGWIYRTSEFIDGDSSMAVCFVPVPSVVGYQI